VTKLGLILTSLTTAATGGAMAVVMIMAFLNHKGGWSIGTQAIAGLLFAIGATLAVMPVGIAVFSGPKAPGKSKGKDKAAAAEPEAAEVDADEEAAVEEVEEEAGEFADEEVVAEEDAVSADDSEVEATVDFSPEESTGDHEFDLGEEFDDSDKK
jgi:hypothetical protein